MYATLTSKSAAYRKMVLVSASSVLALAVTSPALAQAEPGTAAPDAAMPAAAAAQPAPNAPPEQTAPDQTNAAQPIIVTGIRGSLQRDLNAKRNAAGVMDSVPATNLIV